MRRAMIPVLARVNEVLAPLGLRRTTFSALVIARDNPGIRQNELAELLSIEKPNLVQLIDELERGDMIQRRRSEEDRRANTLFVTELGARKCEAGLVEIGKFEEGFTRGLDENEIKVLYKALDRIRANAETGRMHDGH